MLTFCMLVSAFLSGMIAFLWTLEPMNPQEEPTRHVVAKIILIGSFLMILIEIYVAKRFG